MTTDDNVVRVARLLHVIADAIPDGDRTYRDLVAFAVFKAMAEAGFTIIDRQEPTPKDG